MNSWWETPSCSDFTTMIANEIWEGKIVLVFLPAHAPKGFLSQLKVRLSKGENIQYEKFDLTECDSKENKPVESLLRSHFELDKSRELYTDKKASSIFSNLNPDPGKVIVFENPPYILMPKLKEFLIDLGRYFIGIPVPNRHKVLVMIDPQKCRFDDFPAESGISKFHFEGILNKLDQALAIRYYLSSNKARQNPLFESVLISLSKFDLRLCEKLFDSDAILENYPQQLEQFAEENGWKDVKFKNEYELTETEKWERWALGILDRIDDKLVYHSAFLRMHNKLNELEKRLWHSGLQILIPLIEESRMNLIESKKFVFPFKYQNGKTGEIIEKKEDFEIGDICFMLETRQITLKNMSHSEKLKVTMFVRLCRDIRNDLSHLKMPEAKKNIQFFHEKSEVELILEDR